MSEIALQIPGLPGRLLPERVLSDEQLARLVSRGHPRAFAVLYERHHQALSGYCRSIVRDGDDAQDALQSAFTRALAALQAGERDLTVRPWLFRIVHNEAVSLLRRRRVGDTQIDEYTRTDAGIERTVEARERLAALVADLQALSERQRAALVMRELSGLSIEEIAAALSMSPGAAKQALLEARCALHELAEGRAMACADVRGTISERDGRLLRSRKIRAHLHACADCSEFRALIQVRRAELRALVPPLPAAALGGMVAKLLAHGVSGGLGGSELRHAATVGGSASTPLAVKAFTGIALMTAVTAGTAQLELGRHGRRDARPTVPALRAGARDASPLLRAPTVGSRTASIVAPGGAAPFSAPPSAPRSRARPPAAGPLGARHDGSVTPGDRAASGGRLGSAAVSQAGHAGDGAPAPQSIPVTPTQPSAASHASHPAHPTHPVHPSTPPRPADASHPSRAVHPSHAVHPSPQGQPGPATAGASGADRTPARPPDAGAAPGTEPGADSSPARGHSPPGDGKPDGEPGAGTGRASPPGAASHGHH